MNIKHGDIITLDNGDTVKVSLKVISKKVTELVVGKRYKLKCDGEFCHIKGHDSGNTDSVVEDKNWIFVGTFPLDFGGTRSIFYSTSGGLYSMWGTGNLNFVVREL